MTNIKQKRYLGNAKNTEDNYNYFVALLYNRIVNMFDFKNLPEGLDESYLRFLLFCNGYAVFFKQDGKLYVDGAALGGEPDVTYSPTLAIIANPRLKSGNLVIGKDCAVVYTSTADRTAHRTPPFSPIKTSVCPTRQLLEKMAEVLAENFTSLDIAQINSRATCIVTAPTSETKAGVEQTLNAIYEGKPYVVAVDSPILDSNVNTLPLVSSRGDETIKNLRELYQFYLSQFYHAIGIDSNTNFKRERLIQAELDAEGEPLLINILDMINSVKRGISEVNELFGTSIEVELNEEFRKTEQETNEEKSPIDAPRGEESESEVINNGE